MSYFQNALEQLEQIGFLDTILPFLLVFTIIYAVLMKTSILGKKEEAKKYNIAVAFVIAFFVIMSTPIVEIMKNAIPNVSIIIVAVVMFLILIGVMGGDVKWMGGSVSGWIALIAAVVVFYIFGSSAWGWHTGRDIWWLNWIYTDSQTAATVIVLLVFGIVVWFVTKEDKERKDEEKFFHKLGDMFKKE